MTTAFISHSDCLNHDTPPEHPEKVARLKAITAELSDPRFDQLLRVEAPLASLDDIKRAHPVHYIERILNSPPTALAADTFVSSGSAAAAMRAAGGAISAVDLVIKGKAKNAFVAVRPPGHHAERETPMGFCLFGNVAIAAKYALETYNLSGIAVLDFDVHHGNGTQDILWDEPRVLFVSSHQMPLYPGTGAENETGIAGNVLNIPLAAKTGGEVFRTLWRKNAFARIEALAPELILLSAGFDAHQNDPLADIALNDDDFIWFTEKICDLADTLCDGRIVSVLEGGYDLDTLARSVGAHIGVLMERGR